MGTELHNIEMKPGKGGHMRWTPQAMLRYAFGQPRVRRVPQKARNLMIQYTVQYTVQFTIYSIQYTVYSNY